MSLIQEYTTTIIENLPEWNHSGARGSADIQSEILKFQAAASKIDTSLDPDTQLKLLSDIISKYVPDNHVAIKDRKGKNLKKIPSLHKVENLSSQNLSLLGITNITSVPVQEGRSPWIIGTIPDKKLGVVSIPSFGGDIEEQTQKRKQFVEVFFQQKKKNKWQNIIFDFRGNTGGDSEVIKEITERMGCKPIKYADKSEKLNTVAAQKLYAVAAQKMKEGYSLIGILKKTSYYQSSSPSDKFSGSVYILQDGYDASATEGAIYMLSQLPNTITIGENTSGTFAGGSATSLSMSYGSLIIGTEYRERYDKKGNKIKEKEGMHPDIQCSSEKAFSKALDIICSHSNLLISKMAKSL